MSNIFERFFAHDITSITPRILDLEQPIQILGMSVDTNLKSVYRDIPALGRQFAKYAVFPIRPKNRFGWPVAIASSKRHIYATWLPNSIYTQAGMINDFEYHDERSTPKSNPEFDL